MVQDRQVGGVEDGAAQRQPEVDAHREDAHPDGHDWHALSQPSAQYGNVYKTVHPRAMLCIFNMPTAQERPFCNLLLQV